MINKYYYLQLRCDHRGCNNDQPQEIMGKNEAECLRLFRARGWKILLAEGLCFCPMCVPKPNRAGIMDPDLIPEEAIVAIRDDTPLWKLPISTRLKSALQYRLGDHGARSDLKAADLLSVAPGERRTRNWGDACQYEFVGFMRRWRAVRDKP